jgi:murein L,D-transpeptidase YafK
MAIIARKMAGATLRRTIIHGCVCVAVLAATPGAVRADAALTPLPATAESSAAALPLADGVLVSKSDRRLYLLRGGEVLRSYRISLGLDPVGHKQREGDFRTPEGEYRLVRRNSRSDFFLSIQISYPNETDVARARRSGVQPGGAIMIHGVPNRPRKPIDYYASNDWTDGCIAVSNSDMVEIWLMTPPDTPIKIQP